jgi:acetoin utilization deacetylase AcuC-like enzyme
MVSCCASRRRFRDGLIAAGVVTSSSFRRPEPIQQEELLAVHDRGVVEALASPLEVATAIEFPDLAALPAELVWNLVVGPQLLAAGGTCEALLAAAGGESAFNLSGGFHHARRDLSHGFCLINDVALAVTRLRRAGLEPRILIVDLDLHQGDGNATFFAADSQVFTLSVHEQDIFPYPKARSDLDVGLPARADDRVYLERLEEAIRYVGEHFQPDILIYVAGSDPYELDPLGSLQLTREGLLQRDVRVARFASELGCPLVAVPAGGYSDESPAITAAGFAAIASVID